MALTVLLQHETDPEFVFSQSHKIIFFFLKLPTLKQEKIVLPTPKKETKLVAPGGPILPSQPYNATDNNISK